MKTVLPTAPTADLPAEELYVQLTTFLRGGLRGEAYREIARLVKEDERWRRHADSVRDFDLEKLTARHDVEDLTQLLAKVRSSNAGARPHCKQTADRSERPPGEIEPRSEERSKHLDRCVYCRRMRREQLARLETHQRGELLLRDRLLRNAFPRMQELLDELTRALKPELPRIGICFQKGKACFLAIRMGQVMGLWQVRLSEQRAEDEQVHAYRGEGPEEAAAKGPPPPDGSAYCDRVTYERQLDGGGKLAVTFSHSREDQRVRCRVELDRSDLRGPHEALALRVDGGGRSQRYEGDQELLTLEEYFPVELLRAGVTVRCQVVRGDEVLEDHVFPFWSEEPEEEG